MITLQYVISSFLLIIPFIIAGVIEATVNKLFLKTGRVLDLRRATYTAGGAAAPGSGERTVFQLNATTGTYQLIGSNSPYVFFGATGAPTSLSDYDTKFTVVFTSPLEFNIQQEDVSAPVAVGSFSDFRKFSHNQYLLYRYNYGQWLSIALAGVFAISLFRILNKELTISNIIQAAKKFRIGAFGIDTSMEDKGGYTIIKAVKAFSNLLGWIVSFFVFPTSNLMFYISFIAITITFLISFFMTAEQYNQKMDQRWKTIMAFSFIGVIVLFIGFRYLSDKSDPEKVKLRISTTNQGITTGINDPLNAAAVDALAQAGTTISVNEANSVAQDAANI